MRTRIYIVEEKRACGCKVLVGVKLNFATAYQLSLLGPGRSVTPSYATKDDVLQPVQINANQQP